MYDEGRAWLQADTPPRNDMLLRGRETPRAATLMVDFRGETNVRFLLGADRRPVVSGHFFARFLDVPIIQDGVETVLNLHLYTDAMGGGFELFTPAGGVRVSGGGAQLFDGTTAAPKLRRGDFGLTRYTAERPGSGVLSISALPASVAYAANARSGGPGRLAGSGIKKARRGQISAVA